MDAAVPRRAALLAGSRHELLVKIATGGTATVYVGRVSGSVGFSRLVAIKRAHPHLRDDPRARAALIREATLASRVHHANVVVIQDVEETEEELLLVMDYVEGGALSDMLDASDAPLAAPVALRILLDACAGLAAVHAMTDEAGRDVGMIHRDVSPQNILVGIDGTARLTDFGLARLTEVSSSASATVKGKIAYMAPEYIEGAPPTRPCDVFSMGVVVWETLSGRRLFRGSNDADTLRRVVSTAVPRISTVAGVPEPFDAVLARALAKDPSKRYRSIAAFNEAFADVARLVGVATAGEVGALVRQLVGRTLARRRETVRMLADPENATGSMLLAELPFEVPSQAPPSTAPAAPEMRPLEPTMPLDAIDEPEAETLRQDPRKDPPASSEPTRQALSAWIFVAPPLVALALLVGYLAWPTKAAPSRWDRDTPTATTAVVASYRPPAPPVVSATASSKAAAEPRPKPPRPPPTLPDNPYKNRVGN